MNENEKNNINDDENKYIYRYKKDDLKNEESSKADDNTDKHMENESSEHKKVKEKKKEKSSCSYRFCNSIWCHCRWYNAWN